MGNRKTEIQNGTTYVYCYHVSNCNAAPKGNRLINIRTGSATGPLYRQFDYDDSGRLLRKRNRAGTALYNVTYNGKGRAKAINGNSFAYDPNDYRIKKQNRLYLLEGEHLEATYTSAGVLQNKYLRGVVVDEIVNGYTYHSDNANDWTNYTFHHDHLNSVTALTGHAGSTKEANQYDAFGAILSLTLPGTGNEQLFTGRQLDVNTGLYYYRARYYDAEIGRFISEDPLGFQAGVNFYAYVGNNPVNFNDPSGRVLIQAAGGIGGFIIGAGAELLNDNATIGSVLRSGAIGGAVGVASTFGAGPVTAAFFAGVSSAVGNALDQGLEKGFNNINFTEVAVNGGIGFGTGGAGKGLANNLIPNRGLPSLPTSIRNIPEGKTTRIFTTESSEFFDSPVRDTIELGLGIGVGAGTQFTNTGNIVTNLIDSRFTSPSANASGGFVIYPNKPNTNILQSVYAK